MVTFDQTSHKGFRDWLIQRVSAVYMLIYFVAAFLVCVVNNGIDFETLNALFAMRIVRVMSLLFLLSLMSHSWIGMWTLATDYIKPPFLRNTYYIVIISMLIFYLVWGIEIIWGVS